MTRPFWLAYLVGGSYHGGWRPSLYRHMRRYYAERWWRAGYTWLEWLTGRPKRYFRQHPASLRGLLKKGRER